MRDLAETQDVVFAVAFSPDSKKIATAGADRTIRVFEVETGKLLTQIEDHADWIFGVAFSAPTASGSPAPAATRPARSSTSRRKSRSSRSPATPSRFTPSRSRPTARASPPAARTTAIRIWNPDNDGKSIREIGGFGGTVFKLRYSPDGKSLLAVSADKTVHVFDANGSPLRKLQGHNDWIYALAISPDGKTVASGSWDGEVRLWNLADGKLLRNIIAAPGYKPAPTTQGRGTVNVETDWRERTNTRITRKNDQERIPRSAGICSFVSFVLFVARSSSDPRRISANSSRIG